MRGGVRLTWIVSENQASTILNPRNHPTVTRSRSCPPPSCRQARTAGDVVVDHGSIEVFGGDGPAVITALVELRVAGTFELSATVDAPTSPSLNCGRRPLRVDATAGVETAVALNSLLPETRGITRVGPSCRGESRDCGLRSSPVSFSSDQRDRSESALFVSTLCPRELVVARPSVMTPAIRPAGSDGALV